jgi:hypothetical protein
VQRTAAVRQRRRRRAQPFGKGVVHEQEAALAIDRIEADRRVLQEVDDLCLFLANHLFHLPLGGDVLHQP